MQLLISPVRNFSNQTRNQLTTPAMAAEPPQAVIWYVSISAAGLVTLVTVVANLLTVFVLIRHRPLQKSISNLYILSLSVADCLLGLLVMGSMIVQAFSIRVDWFFGPRWMCNAWQVADLTLSTISLYSICAIALDRCWNLEKPLRIFKRSRKLARRLVFCIWLLPVIIWIPIFLLPPNKNSANMKLNSAGNSYSFSTDQWHLIEMVPIVAIPVLYLPAFILIAMFVRISLVVHKHLKFLRDHSNNPKRPCGTAGTVTQNCNANSNSNSPVGSLGTPRRISRETPPIGRATPEVQRKLTDNSQTTVSSGYGTNTLRSQSSRVALKTEWQLAPLSEERSSVSREHRSQSEQIQLTAELQQELSSGHYRIAVGQSAPIRAASVKRRQLMLSHRRAKDLFHSSSAESFMPRRRPSFLIKAGSESSGTAPGSPSGVLRRISALNRVGSGKKFSVIAIPSNLAELLQREGVSQQVRLLLFGLFLKVRAAKAVALILFCFLLCWLPFLTLWPVKAFCRTCIPDSMYLVSIWLNYSGSMLNPLLYTLSSPLVRTALKRYLWMLPGGGQLASTKSRLGGKASFYRSITIV